MSEDLAAQINEFVVDGWGITPPTPFSQCFSVVSGEPTEAGIQAAIQATRRAAWDEAAFRAGADRSQGGRGDFE